MMTAALALGLMLVVGQAGHAGDIKAEPDKRVPVATGTSEAATLIRRTAGEREWHLVDQLEMLKSSDLIVGLVGGVIDTQKGVRIRFTGDLDGISPFPILESAVILHDSADKDLDFTLDRGRVELTNRKESGPAQVLLHIRDQQFAFTLAEPGTSLALEVYARWPRGVPFVKEPDPKHVPTAELVIVVLKGNVVLRHGAAEFNMKAPPGLALIDWDSVVGLDEAPQQLDQLPSWATGAEPTTPLGKQKKDTIQRMRTSALAKGIGPTLDEFINSENPLDRYLAVVAMGALDDLPRLGATMREAKHLDLLEAGVVALRQWIGRAPGQDQILYKGLIEVGHSKPIYAETMLQLLHSYGDEELARPETYQTLIDYLNSKAFGIRGLAWWHLTRLAPAGRDIGYSPLDPEEKRLAAMEKWRKLIPNGTIPTRARTQEKKD
jgi:hypothetical protein